MDHYSFISEFSVNDGPQMCKTSSGRVIYAQKFTAHATDLHRGMILKFSVAIKSNSPDLDRVGADIKWFTIKNSLCDEAGKLISSNLVETLKSSSSDEGKKFIDEAFDHCQKVNEMGKYTPKEKDENGEVKKDEETGLPKI